MNRSSDNVSRVLVTNTVALNTGDAAILFAVIDRLRAAFGQATEVIVYDDRADAVRRLYPELHVHQALYPRVTRYPNLPGLRRIVTGLQLRRFRVGVWLTRRPPFQALACLLLTRTERQDVRHYATSDLIVSSGGTYLVPYYPLRARLFELELARALDKPVILFTQSIGDISRHHESARAAKLLSTCDLVLLRDERSRKHLCALGVRNPTVVVSSDAAFALAPPPVRRAARMTSQLRVGISVRHWRFFAGGQSVRVNMRRYISAMAVVTQHLVERHGAHVIFISTCQGVPEYWTDDSAVAAELVDGLPPQVRREVVVDRRHRSPHDLQEELASVDFVLATRMHLAILALTAGTPVLPIAYEFKTTELFERLGQRRWVTPIEQLTGDRLVELVDDFLGQLATVTREQIEGAKRERDRALAVTPLLRAVGERIAR